MNVFFSLIIGYFFGSLSPSAFISKMKNKNLREYGTGNLGATNTMVVFGKGYGVFVMLFDIAKSIFAYKLAVLLFPMLSLAGLLAGSASVIGHIFPFYMKFKGGKGLAAFGGLILAIDPLLFLILLTVAIIAAIVFNYTVAIPISASILFPVLHGFLYNDLTAILILVVISILIILVHIPNIHRAKRGEEKEVRTFLKELISH